MAIELEKKDAQYFASRKRRYKRMVAFLIFSLLIIVTVVITFIIYQQKNIYYTDYILTDSIERNDSSYTNYLSYNKGILRYSKDGAMAMDFKGNSIWNSTYDMHNPVVNVCGEYVVISDKGNKNLELINEAGHVNSLEVLYPIIKAEVANQGVVAVLMDGGDENYIQFFSTTGKELVNSRTTVEKDGFPVDLSLSKDGQKLVTSYISINGGLIQSKVTFYNFGAVGQNYEYKVVGGFDYGQTLISKVEFINNDTVCVFGDDKFSIYNMEEIPKLIFEEPFETEVKSISYNEDYIGIIQKKIDGNAQYNLKVYDSQGDTMLDEDISYNYSKFSIIKEELIFFSDTELNILRLNGKEKFNATFDQHISNVFPMIFQDEYLIIDNSSMSRIKLIK